MDESKEVVEFTGATGAFVALTPEWHQAKHQQALSLLGQIGKDAKVRIHGRDYTPVSARVETFRRAWGVAGRIKAVVTRDEGDIIEMCATAELLLDTGSGPQWQAVAEGRAGENRTDGMINKRSALENCETSAIGRALANLGLHGGEYASANEVENKSEEMTAEEQRELPKLVAEVSAICAADIEEEKLCAQLYAVHNRLGGKNALYSALGEILASGNIISKAGWKDAISRGRKIESEMKKSLREREVAA